MQTTQQSTQPQNENLSARSPQSGPQQSRIGVYTDAETGIPHTLTVDSQSIAASARPGVILVSLLNSACETTSPAADVLSAAMKSYL